MRERVAHYDAGAQRHSGPGPDSGYAWFRLGAAVLFNALGGVAMWSVVVILPAVQAEFGTQRAAASIPYTMTMAGIALGGIFMGRLADRFGVMVPAIIGGLSMGAGYIATAYVGSLWEFAIIQCLLVAFLGSSATFGPMMADTSLWFNRRRGIAVALCASGNYVAGTFWPPVVWLLLDAYGWRYAQIVVGVVCLVSMVPVALLFWRRPTFLQTSTEANGGQPLDPRRMIGLSSNQLQTLLMVAGVACCVAMSMPQVHIVAYCADLGYGVARGAEMLSLMLGMGIISRLLSGLVVDRIGALNMLLLGSSLQALALVFYLPSNGLVSLYIVSALFGLFQGGIVPAYALLVRENLPAKEAGMRVGMVMMATLAGMALGGWMSGWIYDLTGSYRAAFINGIVWNLFNIAICLWLMMRLRRRAASEARLPQGYLAPGE
jgi:MFS family permease